MDTRSKVVASDYLALTGRSPLTYALAPAQTPEEIKLKSYCGKLDL